MDKIALNSREYASPALRICRYAPEISFLQSDPPIGGGDNPGEEMGGDE